MDERIKEIEARKAEIVEELRANAPDMDLDALGKELEALEEERAAIEEKIEKRAALIADVEQNGKVIETFEEEGEAKKMNEKRITVESPEYRDAFYALIRGDITEEQRAILASPISVDGNGTDDGAAIAIPKTLDTMIWDNIHTAHPILADITTINSGIVMEVTKLTAISPRVQGKKDAAQGAGPEENTFVKVVLAGVDYEKYVELTYAEAKMSQGALEKFLAEEISAELGEALAKDVFARILSDATTAQKVSTTGDYFADIVSALALANMASNPVIYAPAADYFGIIGARDTNGQPIDVLGTLGVELKRDDAATEVTIVDPKMFVLNGVQSVMIEADKDIKNHRVIVSGYMRAEGTLRKNKAAAYIG